MAERVFKLTPDRNPELFLVEKDEIHAGMHDLADQWPVVEASSIRSASKFSTGLVATKQKAGVRMVRVEKRAPRALKKAA